MASAVAQAVSSAVGATARRQTGKSLPALIASYPGDPDGLLVRRQSWEDKNRFFRVTRAKLKFSDRAEVLEKSSKPGPSSEAVRTGVGAKVDVKRKEEVPKSEDDLTIGEIFPSGRVYGMKFRNSRWNKPRSERASPDEEIRSGPKKEWELVNPASLGPATIERIDAAYATRATLHEQYIATRKAERVAKAAKQQAIAEARRAGRIEA